MDYDLIKVYVFRFGSAKMSGASMTPVKDTLVHISEDVVITLDGVAVQFTAGDKIVLAKGKEYMFDTSIALGME